MNKFLVVVSVVSIIVLTLSAAAIASGDPFNATWKLDIARSTATEALPRSLTMKYKIKGNIFKYVNDGVDAEGKPMHWEGTFMIDGKGQPDPNGNVEASSVMRVNTDIISILTKSDGQQISMRLEVVSKDGRTLTRTVKGKNAQGQAIDRVLVFKKQ